MELSTSENLFGKPLDQLGESKRQILRMTKSICLWRSPYKSASDALNYYQNAQNK